MNSTPELPLPDYEPADAAPRRIVLAGGILVIAVALSLGASAWVYAAHYRNQPRVAARGLDASFEHGPAERTSIARDWIEQDRLVHEHLTTYGWVDRDAGVVRIPIERAMELMTAESAKEEKR